MPDFAMYAFNLSANSSPKKKKAPLNLFSFVSAYAPRSIATKNAGTDDDGTTVGWGPHGTVKSYMAPQVEDWLNQLPSSPSSLVCEKCLEREREEAPVVLDI